MKQKFFSLVFADSRRTAVAGVALLSALAAARLPAQSDISGVITNRDKPRVAVIDFRGSGDAQRLMDTFNPALWDSLSGSGVLDMVAKSMYPLTVPQQPAEFHAADWANPPVRELSGLRLHRRAGRPTGAVRLLLQRRQLGAGDRQALLRHAG